MKTNKVSHQQSKTKQVIDNPLVDIASKFGGEFWHLTQLEIKRFRQTDKEEINKFLQTKSDEQD